MAKQINIDWEPRVIVKGKCTGNGCPIKATCDRYTAKEFDPAYGFIRPPHAMTEHANTSGYFPKKCINFLSNQPHRPAIRTVEIQD